MIFVAIVSVADGLLVPNSLLAVTEQVYVVPCDKPVTLRGDELPDAVLPPHVALYIVGYGCP